jgi:hypothetical protein
MPDFKTSIPAAARAADSAGENCELTESVPAADAGTPRTNAITGKHLIVHGFPPYEGKPGRWVRCEDALAILSHAENIERELRAAESRVKELEAQHEADAKTIAEQAVRLAAAISHKSVMDLADHICLYIHAKTSAGNSVFSANDRVANLILESLNAKP